MRTRSRPGLEAVGKRLINQSRVRLDAIPTRLSNSNEARSLESRIHSIHAMFDKLIFGTLLEWEL